jgi:energy-converting hydrogenase Eha subunit A
MELVLVLSSILAIALVVGIPAIRREKKSKKSHGGTLSSAMFAMNELFAPSAANSALIVEEQKRSVKQTGSPDDL